MGTSISMALLKASSTDRHVGKISPLSGFDGKNDVLFISILKAPSTVHSQSRRIHFNAWQVKFLSIFYKPDCIGDTWWTPPVSWSHSFLEETRHLFMNIKYLSSTHYLTGVVLSMKDTAENEQVQSLPSYNLHCFGVRWEGEQKTRNNNNMPGERTW